MSFPTVRSCASLFRLGACLSVMALLAACVTSPPAEKKDKGQKTTPVTQNLRPDEAYLTPLPAGSPSNPLLISHKDDAQYVNPYPAGTHAHFAAQPSYPKTLSTWSADALLEQLTKSNSKLIICLPQQRARVYVNGLVAMDWPVSTGVEGHLTPSGVFRILQKKEDHQSNKYGSGSGDNFEGTSMPFWHRFTWDGVGLHSGRVVAGRRLSHGCVRSPYASAKKFFNYSQMGMPVYITRAVEDYASGGGVDPADVKYRPLPNADYTQNLIPKPKPAEPKPAAESQATVEGGAAQ